MDSKTRMSMAFDLETPDRPPIMGGWLAAPTHVMTLTGCSEDEYWSDPFHWGLEAERVLGSDGVWLEYVLEPLVDAGAQLIWHCDGNYQALVDDVLACGVAGLQGFQRECGMDLEWIVEKRTRNGDPLPIFGPMSVTKTLPFGAPEDVRAEAEWAMNVCRDKASLVFFTSNTLTPDIPLENIQALWQTVQESRW